MREIEMTDTNEKDDKIEYIGDLRKFHNNLVGLQFRSERDTLLNAIKKITKDAATITELQARVVELEDLLRDQVRWRGHRCNCGSCKERADIDVAKVKAALNTKETQ